VRFAESVSRACSSSLRKCLQVRQTTLANWSAFGEKKCLNYGCFVVHTPYDGAPKSFRFDGNFAKKACPELQTRTGAYQLKNREKMHYGIMSTCSASNFAPTRFNCRLRRFFKVTYNIFQSQNRSYDRMNKFLRFWKKINKCRYRTCAKVICVASAGLNTGSSRCATRKLKWRHAPFFAQELGCMAN